MFVLEQTETGKDEANVVFRLGAEDAEAFATLQSKLGEGQDTVEGGPHRTTNAGRDAADRLVYVVYQQSHCLPEFIVTYTEMGVGSG